MMSTEELLAWQILRVCTASADWLACMLCLLPMRRRFSGAKFWGISAAGLGILTAYMELTKGFQGGWFNLFFAGSAALMLVFLAVICREPFWTLVYYCARAFILAGLASSLMWQVYTWSALQFAPLRCAAAVVPFWGGIYAVLFGLYWWVESRNRRGALQPGAQVSLGTAAIAFVIYVFSSINYAPFETPFGGNTMDVYNFRTLIYLAGGALLYGYHLQLHDLQDKREMDAMQNLLHLQYETYKRSQESIDLVNRKYHDLKHQIALLRSQGSEERDGVLAQMESEIQSYEALNVTGNKVLDTVLTAKGLHCQAQGIQMTCVADGRALQFMSVMDISSLFGNALDNAIESTSKIADKEKRLIHVGVSQQKGFLCIKIENCYEGDLQFSDGKLKTTKQDTRYHGFGLKSIESTAEKYGGTAHIRAADGWFELQVLIRVPASAGESSL